MVYTLLYLLGKRKLEDFPSWYDRDIQAEIFSAIMSMNQKGWEYSDAKVFRQIARNYQEYADLERLSDIEITELPHPVTAFDLLGPHVGNWEVVTLLVMSVTTVFVLKDSTANERRLVIFEHYDRTEFPKKHVVYRWAIKLKTYRNRKLYRALTKAICK